MNRLFLRIYGAVLIALLFLWAINLAIFQFSLRPDFDRRIDLYATGPLAGGPYGGSARARQL